MDSLLLLTLFTEKVSQKKDFTFSRSVNYAIATLVISAYLMLVMAVTGQKVMYPFEFYSMMMFTFLAAFYQLYLVSRILIVLFKDSQFEILISEQIHLIANRIQELVELLCTIFTFLERDFQLLLELWTRISHTWLRQLKHPLIPILPMDSRPQVQAAAP